MVQSFEQSVAPLTFRSVRCVAPLTVMPLEEKCALCGCAISGPSKRVAQLPVGGMLPSDARLAELFSLTARHRRRGKALHNSVQCELVTMDGTPPIRHNCYLLCLEVLAWRPPRARLIGDTSVDQNAPSSGVLVGRPPWRTSSQLSDRAERPMRNPSPSARPKVVDSVKRARREARMRAEEVRMCANEVSIKREAEALRHELERMAASLRAPIEVGKLPLRRGAQTCDCVQ